MYRTILTGAQLWPSKLKWNLCVHTTLKKPHQQMIRSHRSGLSHLQILISIHEQRATLKLASMRNIEGIWEFKHAWLREPLSIWNECQARFQIFLLILPGNKYTQTQIRKKLFDSQQSDLKKMGSFWEHIKYEILNTRGLKTNRFRVLTGARGCSTKVKAPLHIGNHHSVCSWLSLSLELHHLLLYSEFALLHRLCCCRIVHELRR